MKFGRSLSRLALAALLLLAVAIPAQAADTYAIDGVHSSALFKIKHFDTANFYGAFHGISGTIKFDAENPANSSIDVTIDANSVDSGNDNRDGHIKSPDFLNTAEFPSITFKSTKVAAAGDGKFEVTGNLTLHGVTKEVTAHVEHTGSGKNPRSGKDIIGFEAHVTVDRTQHAMEYMAGPLSKEIDFILAVEAAKE